MYNDINKDLYVTFKVIQDNKKRTQLERKLKNAFPHETILQELKLSDQRSDVDIAFKTIICTPFHFQVQERHSSDTTGRQICHR